MQAAFRSCKQGPQAEQGVHPHVGAQAHDGCKQKGAVGRARVSTQTRGSPCCSREVHVTVVELPVGDVHPCRTHGRHVAPHVGGRDHAVVHTGTDVNLQQQSSVQEGALSVNPFVTM